MMFNEAMCFFTSDHSTYLECVRHVASIPVGWPQDCSLVDGFLLASRGQGTSS